MLLKDTMQCLSGEAQTPNPLISSQSLYQWATALLSPETIIQQYHLVVLIFSSF